MTETSRFWDGVSVGDAVASPYDAPSEFAQVLRDLRITTSGSNLGAVIVSNGGGLVPSGTVTAVTVQDGFAFVQGNWYHNDAAIVTPIPTPSGATRIDRLVLRKDWAAQTIRLVRIAGVEGGSAPALTQIDGTTWDIPICAASITTGGVITTTDERDVAAPAGGALFVPVLGNAIITNYTGDPAGTPTPITLTGVPADATAVLVSVKFNSGTPWFFEMSSVADTDNLVETVGNMAQTQFIDWPPMIIPMSSPSQIAINNNTLGAPIDVDFRVYGWWVPLH